ncbi:MAG: endonuclease/exonuclease/phosphatase family protein [Nocardioides sp.]
MPTRALGTGTRLRPTWRRFLASGVAVTALASAALAVVPAPAQAATSSRGEATSDMTLVQANIYTGLNTTRFQRDVRKVLSLEPDFVTYNEVPFRTDEVMAPGVYDIYRNMRNRFTAATPVAWNAEKYTALAQGSFRISNWRGKPPGREVELGRRFANWVTLQGNDGRVLSVVSIHVAPMVRGMPDLIRPSTTRLGKLVDRLAPSGPVLVGGDFNVHYTSGRYPRDILSEHDLVPTYDTMGSYFATGDHQGATIDYVFDRGTDILTPDSQYPVELRSDHDAVVAGLSWATDPPTDTQVVANDPHGDAAAQRAALASLVSGIRTAEAGSTVALATYGIDLPSVVQQIKRALNRGVHVRVATAGKYETARERRLTRIMTRHGDSASWLHRCGATCRSSWKDAGMPKTFMMVSDAAGTWTARFDTNRRLDPALVQKVSRVRISTGPIALQEGQRLLRVIR